MVLPKKSLGDSRVVAALQPGCEKMERECENEEEMEIEWGNGEEIEREWGNGKRFTLFMFSIFLYFLPLYPFPISKIVSFSRKMLNTALLSGMSQNHTHHEKIILGRIRCEKAPQVVQACVMETPTTIFWLFQKMWSCNMKWRIIWPLPQIKNC